MGAKKGGNAAKPAQITVILRLAAGGYLVYLGGGRMVQIGFAVFFGATGAFLAGWSLKKYIKGEYVKYGEIPDDEEEQTDDI